MKKLLFSPIRYFAFLFAFTVPHLAFSQDDIIMRNDDVTKAKVEEVGVDVIKYRKADNMDGPIYDMPKSDVYMIVYANGSRDVINPRQQQQQNDSPPPADATANEPIRTAPPEMPVYEQPYCPVEGYLWTPGYWAWGLWGYYWVPGVWVNPPHMGYLWTPGYWGYAGGVYGWREGYWGEHIGFYGGVNYGYGYGGSGYYGGRWEGGAFRYNTAVTRVDATVVHTTYVNNTVVNNTVVNHASFNGTGGVTATATPAEHTAMGEPHVNPTSEQQNHIMAAKNDKSQYASENHGKPTVTAMNKPNGEHYTSEGHVTSAPNMAHTNNATHSTAETNTNHTMQNEQHSTQPAQTHAAQSNPEHTQTAQQTQQHNQPYQQHNNMQHSTSKPAQKSAPKATPAKSQPHH